MPKKNLMEPQVNNSCTSINDTFYLKTFYNFSYTHESGDTFFYTLDPDSKRVERIIEYFLEDLHAEISTYMKKNGHEIIILTNEQTNNGPHVSKDVEDFLQNNFKSNYFNALNDTNYIYLYTNENGTMEYDGTPYGSLNNYNNHYSKTSYCLIITKGKICFHHGVRTYDKFGPSGNFLRKSISYLFDPYFNPDAVKRIKSPPKMREVAER
jgi:hypothetical protein